MKRIAVAMLVALGFTLGACGGGGAGSNSDNVNGNWTATLTNPDGTPAFAFTTSLKQNGGSSTVNVTTLSFTTGLRRASIRRQARPAHSCSAEMSMGMSRARSA